MIDMPNRWIYPVIGSVINLILGGIYCFSLYYEALQTAYNLKLVFPLEWAYSTAMLLDVMAVFIGGIIYDKKGPKLNIFLGATLLFIGHIIGWSLHAIPDWNIARWLYYIGLGVMQGLGVGLTYSVTASTVIKWFPDKPGLASGIVVFGFGISATILAPLIQYFLNTVGCFQTFIQIGSIYFLVLVVAGLFFKDPPADYKPYIYVANSKANSPVQSHQSIPSVDFTLKEAVKTRKFYILWLTHVFSAFTGLMIIGNIVPIIREVGVASSSDPAYMNNTVIPLSLIVTSIFNACGRPFWGEVSDKVSVWKSMQLNFLITAALLTSLSFTYINPWIFLFVVIWVYFCYGGSLALFSPATALYFGRKNFGRIYGLVCTAWGIAGFTGGATGALIRDLTGTYRYSFYLAAFLSLIAILTAALGAKQKFYGLAHPNSP